MNHLSASELAESLGCSERHARRLIADGDPRAVAMNAEVLAELAAAETRRVVGYHVRAIWESLRAIRNQLNKSRPAWSVEAISHLESFESGLEWLGDKASQPPDTKPLQNKN